MTTRRAVGYVRVSRLNGRDKNGDAFISPDVQRKTIKGIAAAKNLNIVAWIEDLDQSGGNYDRPGFQEALQMVEDDAADVVVVAKLTRFARSILDTHRALERIEKRPGCGLIAGDMDVDVQTASGRLVRDLLAAVAAFEREMARENWMVARQAAVANGKFPGGLPMGYRRMKDKRVEPDPVIAPALVDLFRGRAEGRSFVDLAAEFTETTGRPVHPQSLDKIVGNASYLGELRNGELSIRVEPIVSAAEWNAAQRDVAKAPRPKRTKTGSLLSGILRCGSCGRPMSFRGGKAAQYACQRFAAGEHCPAPVLVASTKIDQLVEEQFLARHTGAGGTGEPADRAELATAERELEIAVADLQATIGLDLGGKAGEALAATVETKARRVQDAEAALTELRSTSTLQRRLDRIGERWPDIDLETKRRLLAAALESVTVHRVAPGPRTPFQERVTIVFAADEAAATNTAAPASA